MRSLFPVLTLGLGLGLIGACNSLIGAGAPHEVPSLAAAGASQGVECLHASDCPDSQVCLFRVCSAQCVADKDCQGGRCLQTSAGTACVAPANASCSSNGNCPDGSLCKAGACRTGCTDDSSCLADQTCIAGACVGNDPIHDPGSGGGGGSGGSGGEMAGDSGAAGSSGGSVGGASGGSAGGETAGAGGSVQVGPDTGVAKSGEPCAVAGDLACAGHATTLRFECKGGVWAVGAPCDAGQLCDSASKPYGQCQKAVADCAGHSPGDSFCNSQTRVLCGPDLITETQTKCDSAALCQVGSGAACGACTAEQHQCVGNVLQRCKDDGSGFADEMMCTDANQPCNAIAGACTALACLTVGASSCMQDTLEKCNAARTGFDIVKACGAGLCNQALGKCDICSPKSSSCLDPANTTTCSDDGQTANPSKCPAATPHCVGNGQCVQCTATSDCPVPPDCYTGGCSGAGTCTQSPLGLNAACGPGGAKFCSATHACVECNSIAQCPVPPACYSATCSSGACGTTPLASGTCPGGVCNGSGGCVQCVANANCSGLNSLCRANTCVNPAELIGYASAADTITLISGYLYLVKLPLTKHNATLTNFGLVNAAAAAASVKLGLYGADGNGLPTGGALDFAKSAIVVSATGTLIQAAAAGVPLTPGQYYIGISTNSASGVTLQSTVVTGAGYRITDTYNGTPSSWQNLTGVVAFGAYSNQLAVFVNVSDAN